VSAVDPVEISDGDSGPGRWSPERRSQILSSANDAHGASLHARAGTKRRLSRQVRGAL